MIDMVAVRVEMNMRQAAKMKLNESYWGAGYRVSSCFVFPGCVINPLTLFTSPLIQITLTLLAATAARLHQFVE